MPQQLVFVYNAEAGFFHKLADATHKIISPETYSCSLCALTYGKFAMFGEWKTYLEQLPLEVVFQYKNEWPHREVYDHYPLVALQHGASIDVLLTAEELDRIKSLNELKERLNAVLGRQAKACRGK